MPKVSVIVTAYTFKMLFEYLCFLGVFNYGSIDNGNDTLL